MANHPAIDQMFTALRGGAAPEQIDLVEREIARRFAELARLTGNAYAAQYARDLADGLVGTGDD